MPDPLDATPVGGSYITSCWYKGTIYLENEGGHSRFYHFCTITELTEGSLVDKLVARKRVRQL